MHIHISIFDPYDNKHCDCNDYFWQSLLTDDSLDW